MRRGGWIQTYTGLKMYPLDPRPEEICIEDIAHALSNICRFTGHCREFYSVAQHSVLVSLGVSEENALWGLLHDASEAYLCDIAKPIKVSGEFFLYREAEDRLMEVLAKKYGLAETMPEDVKNMDARLLVTEAQGLGLFSIEWGTCAEPLDIDMFPQDPHTAKTLFLQHFLNITQIKE